MILDNSFRTAIPSASALASIGQVAVAKPGTPIGELVRLSSPVLNIQAGDKTNAAVVDSVNDQTAESYGYSVEYGTTGTLENPSLHSREMDGLVKDIAKTVAAHVAFAKNTVRPLVTEFAEGLHKYLETAKPKVASEAFNIVTLRLPALLKDESFLDTLTGFKDQSILSPDVSFALDVKTPEELNQLVSLGHDRTDKLVVEWLSHKEDNFLHNVWVSFFTKSGAGVDSGAVAIMSYEEVNRLNAFAKADYALAILLFARKIAEQVQDSPMSLTAYKNMCAQYVQYAGAQLVDAMRKIDLFNRSKAIIISKNVNLFQMEVNGEIYPQWLENGGSPETLLGVLISNASANTQALIDEKKADYLSQWNSYVTFFNSKEQNAAFSYAKNFIEGEFLQSLKAVAEGEQDVINKMPNFFELVSANAKTVIDNLKDSDLKDPYGIALLLVAKTRFFYTSSYQILSDIMEASKVNPNVDVREAALLAVINYVSDYAADQIALSSN